MRASIDAIRASHASTSGILWDEQKEVKASTETMPVERPEKDDQLWDVLQPLAISPSSSPLPPERPHGRATVITPKIKDDNLWDLLQSFEAPRMPTAANGSVTYSAPATPAPSVKASGKKHARSYTDHCWGLLGGQGPTPAGVTVGTSSINVSLHSSPGTRKGSPTRRSVVKGGKKKVKRSLSSNLRKPLNPILMYPRYPPETRSQYSRKSEYASKYLWGTSPARMGI